MTTTPEGASALAALPPLPEHQVEVWERYSAKANDSATRRGVYLLLCGWTYREAARAVGITMRPLADATAAHGLRAAVSGTDRAIENHREVEIHATEALIEKGRSGKLADESARDLAVVAGVSRDKIRDHEKGKEGPQSALGLLERIASGLAETGMRLDMSLSPSGGSAGVVDVVAEPAPHTSPEHAP